MPCSARCQSPIVDINRDDVPSYNHMKVRKMSFVAGKLCLGDGDMVLECKAIFGDACDVSRGYL